MTLPAWLFLTCCALCGFIGWTGGAAVTAWLVKRRREARAVDGLAREARAAQDEMLARWRRRGGKIVILPVARARGPYGGAA